MFYGRKQELIALREENWRQRSLLTVLQAIPGYSWGLGDVRVKSV